MKVIGMRARSSPIHKATDAQRTKIDELIETARREGVHTVTVRYTTWIGPGCAAEHGAITIDADGRIYALVYPDGAAG